LVSVPGGPPRVDADRDTADGEVEEILDARDDGSSLGCADDGDAASSPELEQTFVAQRAEHGVLVLTSRTAARSLAGGRRSPGFASPVAIARRISPATCS
jgi:hypothetical protein